MGESSQRPRLGADRIGRVFGVANFALAERTSPDMDALKRAVDRATEGRRFESFRITARRAK